MQLDANLRSAVAPLLDVLLRGRNLRLVARTNGVVVDRAEGSASAAVAWDTAAHGALLAALGQEPVTLSEGATVTRVGDTVVLRAAPDPQRRPADLARDGWLSPLAARTLGAAMELGRNLLVTGPACAAIELCAALVAEAKRPCVVGVPGDAVPAAWPLLTSPDEAALVGADRIGSWSLSPSALWPLASGHGGVVAFIEAGRLDRALIRLEAGFARAAQSVPAPLSVLASFDLVVVLNGHAGPRVTEIAEIALAEEGYRPRLLFASGLPPVTSALVPVAAPSFIGELGRAGFSVLAEELSHAAAAPRVENSEARAAGGGSATGAGESRGAALPASATTVAGAPREPEMPRMDLPETVPGWELDESEEAGSSEGVNSSPDDALLAAAYGLGPPPRPAGLRPVPGEGRSFEDALRRAKAREETDAGGSRGPESEH